MPAGRAEIASLLSGAAEWADLICSFIQPSHTTRHSWHRRLIAPTQASARLGNSCRLTAPMRLRLGMADKLSASPGAPSVSGSGARPQ
ncbi:hypothetical protein BM221_004453 [Beauveria bassiana]|uniref:Uncharacterized protein n=1 Tax=Beauveria bassiana TaxID=176275 RepID=A0A2N6NRC3_BEABA|nr:hypothetical protein BM221_004453 [Beauveria bassiana]